MSRVIPCNSMHAGSLEPLENSRDRIGSCVAALSLEIQKGNSILARISSSICCPRDEIAQIARSYMPYLEREIRVTNLWRRNHKAPNYGMLRCQCQSDAALPDFRGWSLKRKWCHAMRAFMKTRLFFVTKVFVTHSEEFSVYKEGDFS